MDKLDLYFYRHFYDDLKGLNNKELVRHYNKFGSSKSEKRIINPYKLDKVIIKNNFDADFYRIKKKIKVPGNIYNNMIIYKEYLKNLDFKNVDEYRFRLKELKEKELKEKELKDKELKDKELKVKELKELKELKDKELKDKELKDKELKELKDKELKDKELKVKELKVKELKVKELKVKELIKYNLEKKTLKILDDNFCIENEIHNWEKTNLNDLKNNKLLIHLHCYDINQFNEIYGNYIQKIMKNFSVIVTYSEGSYIPNIKITFIRLYNKYNKLSINYTKNIYLIILKNIKDINKIILINPDKTLHIFLNYLEELINFNYNINFKNNFIYNLDNDININISDIDLFLSKNIMIPEYTELYKLSNGGFTAILPSYDIIKYFKKYSMDKFNNILKDEKTNILVFDFVFSRGGTYIYLQNIIAKYKNNINFIIIKGTYQDNKYLLSLNDYYYIDTFSISEFKLFYEKIKDDISNIFINSLSTFSEDMIKFIFNLKNKYLIGISHDFSVKYNKSQILPNETRIHNNLIKYDLIITQTSITSKILDLTNNITIQMPDYYKYESLIKTNNKKINIVVIGNISEIKGILILKEFINYLENNNLNKIYNFKILGTSWPYLQEYTESYYDIDDLNNKLINYKPNIILETSIWQETWSYTLTLAMTMNLPILYYKKNFINNISYRLNDYNKAYEWDKYEYLCNLINIYKQDYFFTIKNEITFPSFYDSLFNDNYIENLVIITSKIIVNEKIGFSYSDKRSIYTYEERINDTIKTIESIKNKFKNKKYKILLIDDSKLKNDDLKKLEEKVDIFLHQKIIPNIDYYTNISTTKGFGEAKQQQIVNNWIMENNITFKNLFKITGRYIFNDNFKYGNFDNYKCNFKLAVEVINKNPHVKDYYYTSLFKIHYNYVEIFNKAINNIVNDENLIINSYGYENVLPVQLLKYNSDSILNISTLGITQNISVWTKEQYKEQLNI